MAVPGEHEEGRLRDVEFEVRRAPAGPFVSVLTISGSVENRAQERLRVELAEPEVASKRVVVDLSEATIYDSWPFPLLASEAQRFVEKGGRLVVVSGENPTVKPFVRDPSLPDLEWFESLPDAMVELLGGLTELAEWPPDRE